MSYSWLVVGLGNPDTRYANTRHNIGHMIVDQLLDDHRLHTTAHKGIADIASMRIGFGPGGVPGPLIRCAKLRSFMNESGKPVAQLMDFFNLKPSDLLIVHDDLDLQEQELKLKHGGGEGGHNGLKSISLALGTRDYNRLRIGIGRPPGRQNPADFVLQRWTPSTDWKITVSQACKVIEDIALTGFSQAQMTLHTAVGQSSSY